MSEEGSCSSDAGTAAAAAALAASAPDLAELLRRRPCLADALPPPALELLASPGLYLTTEPFSGDAAFHTFLVAKVATTWRAHEATALLAKYAVERPDDAQHSLSPQREVKIALSAAVILLQRIQEQKAKATATATAASPEKPDCALMNAKGAGGSDSGKCLTTGQPRFLRLVPRLDLSAKEVLALEYILVNQTAADVIRCQSAFHAPPLELVGYSGLLPCELLDFASQKRPHMAQGLLAEVSLSMNHSENRFEEEFDFGRPSVNRALYSAEAAKALVGAKLTPSEMLKLDQHGALASVLREEAPQPTAVAASTPAGDAGKDGQPAASAVGTATDTAPIAPAAVVLAEGEDGSKAEAQPKDSKDSGTKGKKRRGGKAAGQGALAQAPKLKRPRAGGGGSASAIAALPGAPKELLKFFASGMPEPVPQDVLEGGEGDEDCDVEDGVSDDNDDEAAVGTGDDMLSFLLASERRKDEKRARGLAAVQAPAQQAEPLQDAEDGQLRAYHTDLEYLVDAVELVSQKGRLYRVRQKLDEKKSGAGGDESQQEEDKGPWMPLGPRRNDTQKDRRRERELQGLVKQLGRKIEERMRLTREAADGQGPHLGWIPRLERILSIREMETFEKEVLILLVGSVLLPGKVRHVINPHSFPSYLRQKGPLTGGALVGELLQGLSPDLQSQISFRKAFYKDAALVRDGMIHVGSNGMRGDLTSCPVEIDRRMVDFIVGLDSEVHQLVDGSHMYVPKTKMEQVVLAHETKTLIINTVDNFACFRRNKKQYGLDETISASGLVMLFYGDSGTGKTLTANAVAHLLGKKLLLINFPSLGGDNAAEVVRMVFRESKINDAVLFFDECESIFEKREKSRSRDVNMLLTELERHDGLIILATNRPYDLDEAMHRRITLAIEFHKPDHILRRDIWKALLPPALPLADDVDIPALAMRYELSGGFIKNAILSALSIATTRAVAAGNPGQVSVSQEDLRSGAQLQLRGRLAMVSFERRVVPKTGLDGLICTGDLTRKVQAVVDFEKSKTVLYGQWGFGGAAAFSGGQPQIGSCVLFYGPPGTGKSLAAQAIGFEVGRPLKVVNTANVLDKYVGETGKNIEKVFSEARAMDAVLVFDEAEGLFGRRNADASSSVDKHTNLDTGLLLHWLDTYPGLCILTTNAKEAIDGAFFRRFRFLIEFPKPDRATRARLWRSCVPEQAPLAPDVDFQALATEFESFSGGDVQNAVIRAASRAALRGPADQRVIRMSDLCEAAKEEGSKQADEAVRRLYT